jgi:hypothetical protein
MSRFEALKDPFARAIDRAVQALGDQLDGQLEDGRRKLREAGEALKNELPAALLEDGTDTLLATPPADGGANLVASAARVDQASTQGELLVALLEEACRYGSRSAFFVAKEHGVEGWASHGFRFGAEPFSGRHFGFEGEPWAPLRRANGVVRVEGESAALLASALGTDAGLEGIFIPFVLRSQLAGFLYVERDEAEAELDPSSLRLLTHLAALSVETLPTRAQNVSPTLQDSETPAFALPVYVASTAVTATDPRVPNRADAPAGERAPGADDEAARSPVELEDVELESVELEDVMPESVAVDRTSTRVDPSSEPVVAAELAADPVADDSSEAPDSEVDTMELEELDAPPAPAAEPTTPPEALDETVVETPAEGRTVAGDETVPGIADLGSPAATASETASPSEAVVTAEEAPLASGFGNDTQAAGTPITVRPDHGADVDELFGEETVTEQIQVDASFPRIRSDAEVAREEDGERENDTLELEPIDPSLIEHEEPAFTGQVSGAGPASVAPGPEVAFELDDSRFATPSPQQTVRLDLDQLESQAAAPPPAARIDAAIAAPTSGPALDPAEAANTLSEDATLMAERSAVYRPPVEPPAPPPAPRKSTEVAPPADLSGPGSAFIAGGSDGDQALREEARRLARLLVSEIKLYNEDQLEEGRREGNVYYRLREDIDRSRKMYHERIDPRLTDADDYFHQELVDRLAGGNADLLGM